MAQEAPGAQGPQVTPEIQPQIQSNVQMPLAAAGGGPLREQMAQVGNESAQHFGMAVQMKIIQANVTSRDERLNAFEQKANTIINGDGTADNVGLKNLSGSNAVHAYKPAADQLQDAAKEAIASAPNDDVKRMLQDSVGASLAKHDGTMQQHVSEQLNIASVMSKNSLKQTYVEQVGNNSDGSPGSAAAYFQTRDQAVNAIRTSGLANNGVLMDSQGNHVLGDDGKPMPAGKTQIELDDQLQKMAEAHVNGLLMNHKPAAAQAFLENDTVKQDLSKNQDMAERLSDKVNTEVVRQIKVPNNALEYFKKAGPDGKAEALAMTNKLSDEYNEHNLTYDRVEQLYREHDAAIEQGKKDNYNSTLLYMQQHNGEVKPGVDAETAAKATRVYSESQKHLQKSDSVTVQSLRAMFSSTDPSVLKDAATENLPDYAGKLSPADMKTFQGIQARLRNPNSPNYQSGDVSNWRRQTEVSNEAMVSVGIDPNQPGNKDVAAIRSAVDEAVEQAKASGQKLDRDAYAKIARDATLNQLKGTLPNSSMPTTVSVSSPTTPEDIPPSQHDQIVRALKAHKLPVNDKTIMQGYGLLTSTAGN